MGKALNFEEKNEYYAVTFEGLECAGAEIEEKEFDNCTFTKCDFSEVRFKKCKFIECDFINCNLSLVKIDYSRFADVTFRDSKLIGIDWNKVTWSSLVTESPIRFYRCIVNDCSFYGLSLQELVLEECKAHGVDFREGDFTNGNFTHTDLTGCLFGNSRLTGVDFSDAENYDIDVYQNDIKGAKFSRFEALRLLDSLEVELID